MIPIQTELDLAGLFMDGRQIEVSALDDVRKSLSRNDAYSLAIFALRMAVLAVQKGDKRLLEASFWALLADKDLLDWRDVLVSLSIAEDCYSRVGGDFRQMIESHLDLATERRKETIVDGYLSRSREMRDIETMGYKAVQTKCGQLRYLKCL